MCVNARLNLPEGIPPIWTGFCSEDAMLEKLAPNPVKRIQFLSTALQIPGWGAAQDGITTKLLDSIISDLSTCSKNEEKTFKIDLIKKLLFEIIDENENCSEIFLLKVLKLSMIFGSVFNAPKNKDQCLRVSSNYLTKIVDRYKIDGLILYDGVIRVSITSHIEASKVFISYYKNEFKIKVNFFPRSNSDIEKLKPELGNVSILDLRQIGDEIKDSNLHEYLAKFTTLKDLYLSSKNLRKIRFDKLKIKVLNFENCYNLKKVYISDSIVSQRLEFRGAFPLTLFSFFEICRRPWNSLEMKSLEEIQMRHLPSLKFLTLNSETLKYQTVTSCSQMNTIEEIIKCSALPTHSFYTNEHFKECESLIYLVER